MFAKIDNGQVSQYPLTEAEIKIQFPNTSFPADFSANLPDGYVNVLLVGRPPDTELVEYVQGEPALQDGQWIATWNIVQKHTPEELAILDEAKSNREWQILRSKRYALLVDSEWILDRHREQKELGNATTLTELEYLSWITYRQQLRDITQGLSGPGDAVWPLKPGEMGNV